MHLVPYVKKKMRIYVDNPYFTVFLEHLQRWCQKYFSHPSLVIYIFATPPIKLKLGQQISNGGTTDSKPHGPIIMMGQS